MTSVSSLLSLVITGLAVMGSPGPSTVGLVAVAAAHGVRPAVGYCVGLVVGTTVVLIAVATGVTAVLLALPVLRWVLLDGRGGLRAVASGAAGRVLDPRRPSRRAA